jgi:ferredoxin
VNELVRIALPSGESFTARRDENLLAAAQRAHWLIRFGCRNGNCEACAATLQQGCVEQNGMRIDATAGPQPILLCLAHAQTDSQIDVPGAPLHGNPVHARRCYAQFKHAERDGERWRLTFMLPAGKPLPVYAGQYVQIEDESALTAWIAAAALDGRTLTVFAARKPDISIDARVHLRYPLGYAYRVAVSAQPVWLLCEAATRARAQQLHTLLPNSVLIDMSSRSTNVWPVVTSVAVQAYAADANNTLVWYRQLLAARIPFTEMRSDFAIWRPWQVCRQDDNDNRFVMTDFLDEAGAHEQVSLFTARGHKQLYWAEPMPSSLPLSRGERG